MDEFMDLPLIFQGSDIPGSYYDVVSGLEPELLGTSSTFFTSVLV